MNNPQVFIKSGCINTGLRTYIYVFGFKTTPDDDTTQAILQAYIEKGYCNLLLLDWSKENYSSNMTIVDDAFFYSLAAGNSVVIGREMGNSLIILFNNGLNLLNAVLLGWSLGCPLLGEAGRYVMSQGIQIFQIKCLDPAKPGYGKPVPVMKPLDKKSAKIVFIIHTDVYYFGLNESHGTCDVYINQRPFIDGNNLQPGCPDRSINRACSHKRSIFCYLNAMQQPSTLIASAAANYWDWVAADGVSTNIVDIGNDDETDAEGNYYMTTNPSEPFGQSTAGLSE
ncbi:hypothetical protein O3G_MSEX004065 [Manduca sexta]|nr:hypothetical protein O3G_MSEX004065 [Manduca sexta]